MSIVKTYLDNLEWDGKQRLSTWLRHTFEPSNDKQYLATIGKKVLISAVARVMEPGCKVDNVLIIEGAQGRGKSSALDLLFRGEVVQLSSVMSKEAVHFIQGKWAVEITELEYLNKAETYALKQFMTQRIDRIRPPYQKNYQDYPRQNIFVATTNTSRFARSRRFCPVSCERVNIEWLRDNRDQLWAEAVSLYRAGVPWWISEEDENGSKIKKYWWAFIHWLSK